MNRSRRQHPNATQILQIVKRTVLEAEGGY